MNMSISETLLKKLQDANIPFASVAVTNNQETIFSEHFGTQIVGEEKAVDSSTIYRIASMTKPIVSLAALLLVQKGSLKLDDYAEDYVTELKDLKVANLIDGEIHYEDAKEKITIHHLLAHTSGFAYDFHDPALTKLLADEKIAPLTDKAGAFMKVPLSYQPGTKWEYGVGLDWMGVIIEKVSGQSLNAFIKESIFQPLGMNNSSFDPDDLGKEKLAEMHLMQEAEFIRSTELFDDSVQDFYSGGGGILSTVEDYCKFMRIFLNDGQVDGQEFLAKELLEKMMTNQAGDLNYDFQPTFNPILVKENEWFPEIKKKWSYGFLVNLEDIPERRKAGSLAWSGIFNTYFWIDPESKIAGTVMMQLSPHYDEKCKGILEALEKAVYLELDSLKS